MWIESDIELTPLPTQFHISFTLAYPCFAFFQTLGGGSLVNAHDWGFPYGGTQGADPTDWTGLGIGCAWCGYGQEPSIRQGPDI